MIILSQQNLDYVNGLLIVHIHIFFIFSCLFYRISIELRQAARDLHRLQSNYESINSSPLDATQQINTSDDCTSAEQTR